MFQINGQQNIIEITALQAFCDANYRKIVIGCYNQLIKFAATPRPGLIKVF